MKNKFAWYFPLSKNEIIDIWGKAILSVDANVLLDLYRYHENTRNALLDSLKRFAGRSWLSHQAAQEFFRNRKKVIVSSERAFDEAGNTLSEIRTATEEPLNRLKGNRIIPDDVADSVRSALDIALKAAQETVNASKAKYPDFLESDPILDTLAELFDGSVGDDFSEEQLGDAIKEGKRRLEQRIPPGFLDSRKDGARPYGDYFVWRQLLDCAAAAKKPVIFVTSEGKEDWWERVSGKTTGLHYELLKEAYDRTGQRFLAYRTDRFFRFSAELNGERSNETAAEEIGALVRARTASAPLLRLVSQTETSANQAENSGKLIVELLRPAYRFTCSGRLDPRLDGIPMMLARLISHPQGMPRHVVRAGAGTTFYFNIHVKSIAYQEHLPIGEYVFYYSATMPDVVSLEDIL